MRVLWFIILTVFLHPAYSSDTPEDCRLWADNYKRVSELRDQGLNPFHAIRYMVKEWNNIDDAEKLMMLDKIVIVFDIYKDLKPEEIYKKALTSCFERNGIKQT